MFELIKGLNPLVYVFIAIGLFINYLVYKNNKHSGLFGIEGEFGKGKSFAMTGNGQAKCSVCSQISWCCFMFKRNNKVYCRNCI